MIQGSITLVQAFVQKQHTATIPRWIITPLKMALLSCTSPLFCAPYIRGGISETLFPIAKPFSLVGGWLPYDFQL